MASSSSNEVSLDQMLAVSHRAPAEHNFLLHVWYASQVEAEWKLVMQYRSCGQAYDPYKANKARIDDNKRYDDWLNKLHPVQDMDRIKTLRNDKTEIGRAHV